MFFQIFCCQWHSYAHFGSLFNLNIPDPCGVKVSSHFRAIEPYIYGWGGLKIGLFMAKIAHNGELDPGQRNPPGNWLMGHITSHSMGKHYLGPFKPSSGTYPWQWCLKNALFFMAKWRCWCWYQVARKHAPDKVRSHMKKLKIRYNTKGSSHKKGDVQPDICRMGGAYRFRTANSAF